jgi:hypothetical protein
MIKSKAAVTNSKKKLSHSAESFETVGKVRTCVMTWGTERTNVRDITVHKLHQSPWHAEDPSRLREYELFSSQDPGHLELMRSNILSDFC